MPSILVVDDEPINTRLLRFLLEDEGYKVTTAHSALSALEELGHSEYDLILLDIMMPGMSGLDLCRRIRATIHVPILFLTARSDVADKVLGLRTGGDDYLTRPFAPDELFARIEVLLRRTGPRARSDASQIKHADLMLDMKEHTVTLHHSRKSVRLTPGEARLLYTLLMNRGNTLTRGALVDSVWGYEDVSMSNQLDVYIRRLRTKLEEDPSDPMLILTVRGGGYRFELTKAPLQPGTTETKLHRRSERSYSVTGASCTRDARVLPKRSRHLS